MGESAPFPCAQCGCPAPIVLGDRSSTCPSCGHQQELPTRLDRDLRRHLNAVDATLDDAHRVREAATQFDGQGRPRYSGLLQLAVLAYLGGFCGFIWYAMVRNDFSKAMWSAGLLVVGLIINGIRVLLVRQWAPPAPPPPAGAVACKSCGGHTPIVVTDHAVTCSYCGAEVVVDAKARRRAREIAERELQFTEAQALASKEDRQDR